MSEDIKDVEMIDNEYEEVIVIADLNGVLDTDAVIRALNQNSVALRFANTERPMVQVGQSLFSGEWANTVGTDLIFKKETTTSQNGNTHDYSFVAASTTRLITNKAIVSNNNDK